MKRQPEAALQKDVLRYLAALGFTGVHCPNGSKLAGTPEQRARVGKRLKAEGVMPGFPDLIVYASGGRIAHMEIKAPGNYQQDTQKACQRWLESLGHHYAVVRSLDDAHAALLAWGWL